MSDDLRPIGFSAIFETTDFLSGVEEYIRGTQRAIASTQEAGGALKAFESNLQALFARLGQRLASSTGQLNLLVNDAAGIDSETFDEALAFLGRQRQAIADRIQLERISNDLNDQGLSALQRRTLELERQQIFLRQVERAAQSDEGSPERAALDAINDARVEGVDLGKKALSFEERLNLTYKLQADELQDTIAIERLRLTMSDANRTAAERELASRKELLLQARRTARLDEARAAGIPEAGILAFRQVPLEPRDLGLKPPPTVDENELRFNQLILQAIADRRKALELEQRLRDRGIQGTKEELRLRTELATIAIRHDERVAKAQELAGTGIGGADPKTIEEIGNASEAQLGAQLSSLERVQRQQQIILAEVEARVRAEQRLQQTQGRTLSQLEEEQALAQRISEALAAGQRRQQFADLGGDPTTLDDIRKTNVDLERLAASQLSQAQRQTEQNRILSEEIADRVRAEENSLRLKRTDLSTLERQKAELEAQQRLLDRAARSRRFEALGGSSSEIDKVRKANVERREVSAEINVEQAKELQLYQIMQQELADLVTLKRATNVLESYTTSALKKHEASLQIMAVQAARVRREFQFISLGGAVEELEKLRATSVTMRDLGAHLGRASKQGDQFVKTFQAGSVALGVGVVVAIRSAIGWLQRMSAAIIDNVTFFERLELSIEFFSVRAVRARNESISYAEALGLVQAEAQGTVIWLQRLAVASPFTSQQVGTLFRVAQAYGLTRDEVVQLTPLLLDFAAAAGLDSFVLERLALAMGQIRSRGKLTGEEVRQLGNSGLPIRDILVKALGIANSEFEDLLESGQLTSDVVIPAIIRSLEDFRGAGARVAFETLGGIISAFQEVGQIASFQFFGGVTDEIKEEFLDFFKVVNDPKNFAFVRALGTEVGIRLANAFAGAREAVSGLAEALQRVTPAQVRFLLGLAIAGTAVTVLTVQLGLLILALNLLIKPFILLPTLIAVAVAGWGAGFKNMAESVIQLGKLVTGVFANINKAVRTIFAGKRAQVFTPEAMGFTEEAFGEVNKKIVDDNKDAMDEVVGNALIAGKAGAEAFYEGWQIPKPAQRISDELSKALAAFGSGPELSRAGTELFNGLSRGLASGDFGFLDQVAGQISRLLSTRVSLGEIVDADVPRGVFRLRDALAQAIQQFRSVGSVGPDTFARLRTAAGSLAGDVEGLVRIYFRLAPELDAVEAAQKRLNEISDTYRKIIEPIRKELEKISDQRRELSEDREIRALQRVLENEAAGQSRKREAQLGIQEILMQRQLRTAENQRDAESEIAENQRDSAQKRADEVRAEFDLLKAQIDARLEQLGLVAQERDITNRLEGEIKQLRDREKTDLEKQIELMNLINQEIRAQVEEAKARFTLNKSDSTELEKQQALLVLSNAELERQQRIAKAVELGFDASEIERLRDLPITLKDIGEDVKGSLDGVGDGMSDAASISEDLQKLTEEWNATLQQVKQSWIDIKEEAELALKTIDDNLPEWLKILPDQQGGEPKILDTLERFQGLILGIGAAFAATKILSSIAGLVGLLGRVTGPIAALGTFLLGLGGTAAAAGGGAAAAGGGAAAGGIGASLLGAGVILAPLAAAGALWFGVPKIVENIQARMKEAQDRLAALNQERDQFLLDLDRVAGSSLSLEVQQILAAELPTLTTPFGALIVDALRQGLELHQTPEQIAQQLRNLFKFGLQQGLVAPDEAVNFEAFVTSIQTSLSGAVQRGIQGFASASATRETLPLDQIIGNVAAAGGGASAASLQDQVARAVGAPILEGINRGLDPALIGPAVFERMSAGVASGLAADDPAMLALTVEYINAITDQMAQAALINSPSGLTRDKVGKPMGQGVITGIEAVLPTISKSRILAQFIATMQSKFVQVREEAEAEFLALKENVLKTFGEFTAEMATHMTTLYTTMVTNGFVKIRLDAEQEIQTLRTSIVNTLVGEEDSLISDLRTKLFGAQGSQPADSPIWQLGEGIAAGMAKGFADNVHLLEDAVLEGLADTLDAGANALRAASPSEEAADRLGLPIAQGAALGVTRGAKALRDTVRSTLFDAVQMGRPGLPARAATALPSNVRNAYNNIHYHLTVVTPRASQGVVGDFESMRLMRPGT